jgi:hypothetical protein
MDNNISPEEILRRKEIAGGLVYDDPVREPVTQREPENPVTPPETKFEQPVIREVREVREVRETAPQDKPISSLGKSQASSRPLSFEMGWKNIPADILPSKGDFYPEGTKIAIRAAEVREIRHFSTIDEDDKLDIEEKLTHIIDRCSRMEFPGEGVVSYKDLKQEDRFFIIMAIRDLTFVKGENSIILKPQKTCNQKMDCPFNDGIELRTGALSSYELDEQVSKYYNPETRSFVFNIKKIEKVIELFIPSIGVTQEITSFVSECSRKKVEIDEGFLAIAPFLFNDWRDLSYEKILMKMRESDYWTKEEFSLYFELSERIKMGTMLDVKQKCPVCGDGEVTAKITFPNGIRSLFLISDIFRELL